MNRLRTQPQQGPTPSIAIYNSDGGYCLHGNKDAQQECMILSVKAFVSNSIPYAPMLSLCDEPPRICDMMTLHM